MGNLHVCGQQIRHRPWRLAGVRWPESRSPSRAQEPTIWRSVVFAPLGDGQRRRRGSDGVRLTVAVVATLCAVLALQSNWRPEQVIAGVLSPPPDGVRWLVDVFWIGGSAGTVAALLLLAAVRRRWDALRDLAIAAGGALAVCGILVLALGAAGGQPDTVSFAGYHLSFRCFTSPWRWVWPPPGCPISPGASSA
jgi:hypothetical protein